MLSVFLLEQVRQAQDCVEKTLAELCDALSQLQPMGSCLAEQLVQSLRKIESPDELFDTLHSLELLLLESSAVDDEIPGLDSSSVLGVFLRKVLLSFHTTMFEGLSDLFSHFTAYFAAFDDSVTTEGNSRTCSSACESALTETRAP